MVATNSVSSTDICAADITVLHLLHSVPRPPFQNSLKETPLRRYEYILSFETERRLASTLAFLSSIKHDSNYIPAVAIVEGPRPAHLKILVAVNRVSYDDGKQNLQQIKEGFEGLLVALSRSPRTSSQEDEVLKAIISMCSERILVRLRLAENSRQVQKQPIVAVINEAIPPLERLKAGKLQHLHSVIDRTLDKMKSVIKLLDVWKRYQTADSLKNLVIGIHDLWQVGQLQAILEAIPNRDMNPSPRKNLHNTIKKVARYHEAAKILCRIAKKSPTVQNMVVVPVELPKEAFDRSAAIEQQPTLESVLDKFEILRKKGNIDKLYHVLKVEKEQAGNLFSKRLSRTLAEAKIHAEIQIVCYSELNRTLKTPRIVRSSKTACFLCDTFISMYKEICTPRCHGKLYPGWRLPQLPAFAGLQTALNEVLEQLINRSLRTMLSTGRKIMYPDPSESSLCSLPISASTLVLPISRASEQVEEEQVEEEQVEEEQVEEETESHTIPPADPLLTEHCESESSSEISDNKPGTMDDVAKGDPELLESNSAPVDSRQSAASAVSGKSDTDLIEGLEVLQSIRRQGSSRLYRAGPLEIYLEGPSEPSQSSRSDTRSSDIPVKIKWLSQEELGARHTDNDVKVIDADLLGSGSEVGIKADRDSMLQEAIGTISIRYTIVACAGIAMQWLELMCIEYRPTMQNDAADAFSQYTKHLAEASKHRQLAQWEDAFRELKSAENLVDLWRQRVVYELGAVERRLGRVKNATAYLEEALSITRVDELQRIHILGELAIVYQHAQPVEASKALEAAAIQYEDAKDFAAKEWQNYKDFGLLQHKHRAVQADAQACRAVGNVGLINYLRSQENDNTALLHESILQVEERVQRAQGLQTVLKQDSSHERIGNDTHASLIHQARTWESIGYDRSTLARVANGEVEEALRCGERSQALTRQSNDSTVRGLSRFFYGYALLKNNKTAMAQERLRFHGAHPDACTSTIALCREPLQYYPKYLEEITELGLNMEHYDEHGYSALDYTIFQESSEMKQIVLQRLREGNYDEAEKDESKRLETITRLEQESVLKKHYREVFQECLRPNLLKGGKDVVPYSDFVAHGRLPLFTDGLTREYSSVRAGGAAKDCVVFFSYRWRRPLEGRPDDAVKTKYGEGTQYGRMCNALESLLNTSTSDNRVGNVGPDGENLYIWLDCACIDQDNADPGIKALPIITTQCDVMITLNEPGFFERGWCAVEVALEQTIKQSFGVHKWYEHNPVDKCLQDCSHPVIEDISKLQVTRAEDKPVIEFLFRQRKFLGNGSN
ncbi:hypothetical protein G7054_g10251 [Neopestalotiopsis clavispora]|nr:hypothetical protein G7054_g10251 [Neopestalotiopsis clavispora]